jgi:hypothetical protein
LDRIRIRNTAEILDPFSGYYLQIWIWIQNC